MEECWRLDRDEWGGCRRRVWTAPTMVICQRNMEVMHGSSWRWLLELAWRTKNLDTEPGVNEDSGGFPRRTMIRKVSEEYNERRPYCHQCCGSIWSLPLASLFLLCFCLIAPDARQLQEHTCQSHPGGEVGKTTHQPELSSVDTTNWLICMCDTLTFSNTPSSTAHVHWSHSQVLMCVLCTY